MTNDIKSKLAKNVPQHNLLFFIGKTDRKKVQNTKFVMIGMCRYSSPHN